MKVDNDWLLEEKYGGIPTEEFENDKERLAKGEPLGYVIGWQPFLGLKIHLDSHPLIPRPETEWWTEQLMTAISGTLRRSTDRAGGTFSTENDSVPRNCGHELSKETKDAQTYSLEERTERATKVSYERSELENLKYSCGGGASQSNFSAEKYAVPKANMFARLNFLDLCAGSGAIGCAALARLPNAQVYFGELDSAHEATILKNIRENNLDESRAHIDIGDLFEPFKDIQFDIIAANPPYVPNGRELPASVADYEPAIALYSGDDGLDLIRRIAAELPHRLAPDGEAWIEIDSAAAAAAAALFTARGFVAEIRTDQYDQPRVIVVSFS